MNPSDEGDSKISGFKKPIVWNNSFNVERKFFLGLATDVYDTLSIKLQLNDMLKVGF